MKILCIADTHAQFSSFDPEKLPDADMVLIAGDITDVGVAQLTPAKRWLRKMAARYGVVVYNFGNHDIGINAKDFVDDPDNLHCLQWASIVIPVCDKHHGIIGECLSTCFDRPYMVDAWDNMTDDFKVDMKRWQGHMKAEIVVAHCPPLFVLDEVPNPVRGESRHIGSPGLLSYIYRHKPRLVVCGHVHECGMSSTRVEETLVVNAARGWVVVDYPLEEDEEVKVIETAL